MLLDLFIADAMAQTGAAAPPGGGMANLVMLVGLVVIFYFLIWRPQAKRQKEHKALVEGVSKGDEIITNGGLLGKVVKVEDDFILVQIAAEVEIKLQRQAIMSLVPKGTLKDLDK